jgi:hypothetical protein
MPARYLAVDIAEDALARSLARLAPEFPEVELGGIVVDFTDGLDLEADLDAARSRSSTRARRSATSRPTRRARSSRASTSTARRGRAAGS